MTAPVTAGARMRGTQAFWAAFLLFVIVWTIRATVAYQLDLTLDSAVRPVYSNAMKLALWAAPAVVFTVLVRGDPALHALRVRLPIWRTLPAVTVLIVAYLAGVAWDVARKHGVTLAQLGEALAARGVGTFAGAVPSAFSEELMFRGLVLTELTERWGFWRGNLVSSALFVAMHWQYRLWSDGVGLGVVADAPALFAIALALGFVTWRTGSIWPAVVFHAANNTLSGVL